MAKYIISVIKNSVTGQIQVAENAVFKGLNAITFEIDDDHDFGSIDPKDLAVQMFKDPTVKHTGIERKQK